MTRVPDKLTATVLVAILYQRKHGKPATWSEIARAIHIRPSRMYGLLSEARRRGLLAWDDDVERSLRVLPSGYFLASSILEKRCRR